MKADHETGRSIEAELADLRQQLAAANRRITELEAVEDGHKSAAALADTQEQIELIVDTLPVLLAYIDAEQRYLYVNRLYAEWYGLAKEKIIGKHVRDVLHEATYQKALPLIKAALNGQRITYENDAAYDVQGQPHTVQATYVPHLDENGQVRAFLAMVEDITERKQAEERVKHLNAVLRAIRGVNQLIVREKDRRHLVQSVCDTLIETRGYYNAWVALLDESMAPAMTAEAGLGKDFSLLVERLERGEPTYCMRRALAQVGILAVENPPSACTDCPLSNKYGGRGGMATRIEHAGKVYGLLVVSTPGGILADEEEQGLFEEVARDIALALHDIALEEERERAEAQLAEQLDELRRWHAATLGRETRILDLKREVNELLARAGQPPRYPSADKDPKVL